MQRLKRSDITMTALDKVLIDTSAWIEFFRQIEPYHSMVLQLMSEERICTMGIIVAELMQGAKSEKELAVLRDFVYVFPFLRDSQDNWQAAGELSFRLRHNGKAIGLADCYIAIVAKAEGATILSLDHHFQMMKDEAGIKLLGISP
jgi:predicted nucleic acid-binding protein